MYYKIVPQKLGSCQGSLGFGGISLCISGKMVCNNQYIFYISLAGFYLKVV